MVRLLRALVGMDCRTWYDFHHLDTDPLEAIFKLPRKSGHKKSGLNEKFGRDHSVPGLFSELFNVAASRPAQMTTEPGKISHLALPRQGKVMVNEGPGSPWR